VTLEVGVFAVAQLEDMIMIVRTSHAHSACHRSLHLFQLLPYTVAFRVTLQFGRGMADNIRVQLWYAIMGVVRNLPGH
jgi:hypothetical protein